MRATGLSINHKLALIRLLYFPPPDSHVVAHTQATITRYQIRLPPIMVVSSYRLDSARALAPCFSMSAEQKGAGDLSASTESPAPFNIFGNECAVSNSSPDRLQFADAPFQVAYTT